MFRSTLSRERHRRSPEKMENNGSSKANAATTLNSVGDIKACVICKQNYFELCVSEIYIVTICHSCSQIDNSATVLLKIATLYAERLMSDICLVVGGTEYPAHRLILCASSEVFQAWCTLFYTVFIVLI